MARNRILVVDDEEIMRSSLSDWLKEDGYYVQAVEDGYKAIEKITDTPVKLVSYSLNAVTHGKDAMGTVTISVERKNKQYRGHGVATDVIEASAHAFLNAINRILFNSYK